MSATESRVGLLGLESVHSVDSVDAVQDIIGFALRSDVENGHIYNTQNGADLKECQVQFQVI